MTRTASPKELIGQTLVGVVGTDPDSANVVFVTGCGAIYWLNVPDGLCHGVGVQDTTEYPVSDVLVVSECFDGDEGFRHSITITAGGWGQLVWYDDSETIDFVCIREPQAVALDPPIACSDPQIECCHDHITMLQSAACV